MYRPADQMDHSHAFSEYPLKAIGEPSAAVQVPVKKAKMLGESFGELPTIWTGAAHAQRPTIAEELFISTAEAKIWTSSVMMHLDREKRDRLFRQLDTLHDADEWVEGDKPVALGSFQSFVRALVYHSINCRPALALGPSGNLLALWQDGADKLTIEFLSGNISRWLVHNHTSDGPERASGVTPLQRLKEVLQPYQAARWFDAS